MKISLKTNSSSDFNLDGDNPGDFNLKPYHPGDFNLKPYPPGKFNLTSSNARNLKSKDNRIREINILDLFSGSGSWVKGWRESTTYKANIDSVDIIKQSHVNFCMDVRDFKSDKIYDIVYASFPCTHFSQMRNINKLKTTKEEFNTALELAKLSFEWGKKAKYAYIIENPYTGKAKNYFPNYQIVDYSLYDFPMRKRTAIWSNIDLKLKVKINGDVNYNKLPLQYIKNNAVIPEKLSKHIKWMIIKYMIKERLK